jgi:hypothetical protein
MGGRLPGSTGVPSRIVVTSGPQRSRGDHKRPIGHLGWSYAITVKLENADAYLVRGSLGDRPICTSEPQPFEIVLNGHFSPGTADITVAAHGGTKRQGILHSLTTSGTVERLGGLSG